MSRKDLTQHIQKFQEVQRQIYGEADPALEKTARSMDPQRSREFTPVDIRKITEEAQSQMRRGKSENNILDAIATQYGNNVADMVSTRLLLPESTGQRASIKVGQKYKNLESGEETEITFADDERVTMKDEFGELDLPTDDVMNVLASWQLQGQEEALPDPELDLPDLDVPSSKEDKPDEEDLLVEKFKAPASPPLL